MFDKKYHIQIITPLGIENALLNFCNDPASIEINKGCALLDQVVVSGNTMAASVQTEVPFSCKLEISAEIKNCDIEGKINLDKYLIVEFKGKETDGNSIPGLR